MKTFYVTAKETVYYGKIIQCENEEVLRKLLQTGDILFETTDVNDGEDFEVLEIGEN